MTIMMITEAKQGLLIVGGLLNNSQDRLLDAKLVFSTCRNSGLNLIRDLLQVQVSLSINKCNNITIEVVALLSMVQDSQLIDLK
jgi:CO dehydrogenase/acetyl-CoA synthase epsilon subunit